MADGYNNPYLGGFFPLWNAFSPYGTAGQQPTANPTTCTIPGTSHYSSSTSTAIPDIVVESGDDESDHTLDSDEEQVCSEADQVGIN